MDERQERRDELIGALLGGQLDASEEQELAALVADDPELAAEIAELQGVAARVGQSGVIADPAGPSRELDGHIQTIGAPTRWQPRMPRRVTLAVAASLVVLGGIGGAVVQGSRDGVPTGSPGELGALEAVSFATVSEAATVEGGLIAHTWGTETDMRIDGLATGQTYDVVLVDDRGRDLGAGSFLGATATVTCRMNAAVLREQVRSVEVREADGDVVAQADVPRVS